MSPGAFIRLGPDGSTASITRERVYFAFGSGRFSYDCESCGAQCCRGHGYELPTPETVRAQIMTRSAVRFFLTPSESGTDVPHMMKNCPPTCFFLTDEKLCGIHLERGYAAKPETCRFFPFNNFRRFGPYLIVAPHPTLCPLAIVPNGETSDLSRHDRLFEDMAFQGISGTVSEVDGVVPGVDALIGLEQRIAALADAFDIEGGYVRFAEAQLAATRDAQVTCDAQAVNDAAQDEVRAGSIAPFVAALHAVLGAQPTATHLTNDELTRALIATTSALRARLIFATRTAPHQPGLSLARVPRFLTALNTLAVLALDAGMRRITYQTLSRLFLDSRELLTMLSFLDCEMVWRPEVTIDMGLRGSERVRANYLHIVRGLIARGRGRGPTLGALLCEHSPEDGVERVLFLKRVARRLYHNITPATQEMSGRSRRVRPLKPALQRLLLGGLSHQTLMRIVERRLQAESPPAESASVP